MFYHDVLDERAGIKEMDDNSTVVTYSGNSTENMTIPIKRSEMNYLNYEAPDNVEWLWSITVAIFVLFGMIGAFASGAWADYFGRFVHFSFCFHSTCSEVSWYLCVEMMDPDLGWVFGSILLQEEGNGPHHLHHVCGGHLWRNPQGDPVLWGPHCPSCSGGASLWYVINLSIYCSCPHKIICACTMESFIIIGWTSEITNDYQWLLNVVAILWILNYLAKCNTPTLGFSNI